MADARRLEQILVNYLTNAFKHGSCPITVSIEEASGSVEVRVADSGPGVPADFVPHLFEKFSQAARGGMRARGCGLGLAIVRSLAEGQGGQAWYEPRPHGGACFVVRLPAVRPELSRASAGPRVATWS